MWPIVKFFIYASVGLVAVVVAGVAGLAVTGLPAPPGMEAHGEGRIPWKWVWRSASVARALQHSTTLAAWDQEQHGMLVYAGRRIHRIKEPGEPPQVVEALPPFAQWPRLSPHPGGRHLVYSLDEGGGELYRHYMLDLGSGVSSPLTVSPARTSAVVFSADGAHIAFASTARNGTDFDVYIQQADSGTTPQMVYRADGSFFPEAWSPDGNFIVVVQVVSHATTMPWLFDVSRGEMHSLIEQWDPTGSFSEPEWSPDGKHVFFLSNHGSEYVSIRRLGRDSGQVETLSANLEWDVSEIELSPDGRRLVFSLDEEGIPKLHVLDVVSLEIREVRGQPAGVIRGLKMQPRHNVVGFNVASPSSVRYVSSYRLDDQRFVDWSVPVEDESALPPMELVRYPTFDQVDAAPRQISAYLFPAATSFGAPRPVLIDIHGGPALQASPTPAIYHQAVRRAGISVLRPNVRGSAGYGKKFVALDNGKLREDAVRDIGALLDWVATRSDLDDERVAVMGSSYGGYLTLASLVRYSDRVRCGIDLFGFSNLVAFLEASEEHHYADAQRAEFGDERDPEIREFLRSISPLTHAGKITVPLLVYQGVNDVRIKAAESRQIVERVRANGVEVWYLEAANEGHNLERPLNQMYFGAAMASFLERHLPLANH